MVRIDVVDDKAPGRRAPAKGKKQRKGKGAPGPKRTVVVVPQRSRATSRPNKPKPRGPKPPSLARLSLGRNWLSPVDATLRRFLAAVANPFDGPLSGGIGTSGLSPSTTVTRRRNVCTVTITPGDSGVDVFIPNGCLTDPFVATASIVYGATNNASVVMGPSATDIANAQNWTLAASTATTVGTSLQVSVFNRDTTVTIPAGSTGRVVASAVRIKCNESANVANGVIYHYWVPPTANLGGANLPAPTAVMGSVKNATTEALGIHKVPSGTLTLVNPTSSGWIDMVDISSAASVPVGNNTASKSWPSVGGTRLFFDATGSQRFTIEVATIVEYYHDSHKQFAKPAVTHPSGDQVVQAVNAFLTTPGSNNTSVEKHGGHTTLAQKLENATSVVTNGVKLVGTTMAGVYNGIKGAKAIRAAMGAAEAAEAGALMMI